MTQNPENLQALELLLKKHKKLFSCVVLTFALFHVCVVAPVSAEPPDTETVQSNTWDPKFKRLRRGGHNTVLGWVELPMGVTDIGEEHGFGAAATWGVLHGLGRAMQRTAAGVFEVITFPFDLNENKPLIEPEYILE